MFVGTQYYRPPHPPQGDWERDFKNMADTGLSMLKLWIYWSRVNPRPEQWVWDDLDRIYDLAAQHDLKVMAQLMPDAMPYWFKDQHPEALFRDASGNIAPVQAVGAMGVGGVPGPNFDHPTALRYGGEFMRQTAEHFRDHPAMYVWDIWNELWPFVTSPRAVYYNDATIEKWQAWLENTYGSIAALNDHWQRSYATFAEVEWPVHGIYADLGMRYRFDQERVADWMQWRIDLMRQIDPDHLVSAHTGGIGPVAALNDPWGGDLTDPWLFTEDLDAWGTSCYLHTLHEWSFMMDSARSSAQGRSFWVFEMNGGRGHYQHPGAPGPGFYSNHVRSGEEIRSQVLLSLSHGAEGAIFWQWRPEHFGPESPGWGLTTAAGDLTDRTEALRGITTMLGEHESLFEHMTFEPSPVAILWEPRSYQAERLASWKPGFGYLGGFELFGYHRALTALGLEVEYLNAAVVVEKGVPDHVKFLCHPYPVADRDELVDKLRPWVEAGGTLLVGPGVGLFDDRLNGSPQIPPPLWRDLLGVRQKDFHYPDDPRLTLLADPSQHLPGYHLIESYTLEGALPLGIWESQVALAAHHLGKGQAISVGTFLGQPISIQEVTGALPWLSDFCDKAGITPSVRVIGEQVFSRRAVSGETDLLFVHNAGNQAATAWITTTRDSTVTVTDLLSGEALGSLGPDAPLCIQLKALDSALYAIEPGA